jgi:single-strand DNA-binding protein
MTDARIRIQGNLGKDPEIQSGQSGALYARFSVASTERIRDKQTNEWSDGDTSWWNCTAFGNTAEMIAETLTKGDPVTLDGKVKIRSYESNGETRQSVDVTVDSIGLDLSRAKRKGSSSRQAPAFDPGTVPF